MSLKGIVSRAAKAAGRLTPACGGVRVLRAQVEYGPPYVLGAGDRYHPGGDDRCPHCGRLGCGVRVLTHVAVTRDAGGRVVDERGNVFEPAGAS